MLNRIKKGQIYIAKKDVPMFGLVILNVPGSTGFNFILPRGTMLVVVSQPRIFSKAVYATPLNYKELETAIVPSTEFESTSYKEYVICFEYKDLPNFTFVENRPGQ